MSTRGQGVGEANIPRQGANAVTPFRPLSFFLILS